MAGANQEPILASDKINDVLKRHPELLDVIVVLSPAFAKLRNPMVRRVQTRLVSVAQAAGIAGLYAPDLTRRLNVAAGITAPAPEAEAPADTDAPADAPSWLSDATIVQELDARPIMARGEEPFKQIMGAAQGIPTGSAFRLIAGFEPLPLYGVLEKQGFAHYSIKHATEHWEVIFHREGQPAHSPASAAKAATAGTVDWSAPASAEVTIDVSELVPPEPMIKILETLETLPADGRLLVHHVRRPIHLYDRLDEMGYAHDTRDLGPGQVEVLIQKRLTAAP
jgi:uncharacterized protein (DUF2249 family)